METNIAIEKAVDFLINARTRDNLWSDFQLPVGESNDWVTSYTGTIMTSIGNLRAFNAATESWEKHGVKHFFDGYGGWAYNHLWTEDADSTAWGIRFAINLGLKGKLRTEVAEKFLLQHITSNGGIRTFFLEKELRKFLSAGPDDPISGWIATHTCVTAAVALLPFMNNRLAPWLHAHQLPDGSWDAYWWPDAEYSTSLAIEALVLDNPDLYTASINKSVEYIINKLGGNNHISNEGFPEGSPFATALALKILVLSGRNLELKEITDSVALWLLDHQRSDGSWESSALMRVPPAKITDAAGFHDWNIGKGLDWGTITIDQHAIFTTASVLGALALFNGAKEKWE
jgi:squalene-hopene/tetraprenyl-beta-curcumene cyclase